MAQERLRHNPHDADALMWMGAIYDATGEFDKAVEYGRRATEAAPNNAEIHCQLADTLGDKALKLGCWAAASRWLGRCGTNSTSESSWTGRTYAA